jgi:hypothetical protein
MSKKKSVELTPWLLGASTEQFQLYGEPLDPPEEDTGGCQDYTAVISLKPGLRIIDERALQEELDRIRTNAYEDGYRRGWDACALTPQEGR